MTTYQQKYKERKVADGFEGLTHGKPATYNIGCRCDECRAANTSYKGGNVREQAHAKARRRFTLWAMEHHKEKYDEILEQITAELKGDR